MLAAACSAFLWQGSMEAQAPGIVTTIAGNGSPNCDASTGANCFGGDNGLATSAELYSPYVVAVGRNGNWYIADTGNNRIRKVNAETGIITTVAGDGSPDCNTSTGGAGCYGGDGGLATDAQLYYPFAVALDKNGDLYIADTGNNRIRKVNAQTGIITTVAGDGSPDCDSKTKANCYGGDGEPAASAHLWLPFSVAFGPAGNFYIADTNNNRIRKVNVETGIITTVAGNGKCSVVDSYGGCYSGDGGSATKAELWNPAGVFVDTSGDLYLADEYNNRIRMVNALTGIITSVAGNGYLTCTHGINCTGGYNGDGIPATSARLNFPFNVTLDSSGSLYIADYNNNRIRKVDGGTQIITTVAGNGKAGYAGNGGQGTKAELNEPSGVTFDNLGNLLIADSNNNVVRRMQGTPAATPLIGPASGIFAAPLSVSITDATSNAAIYYSVNGGAWNQYTAAIKVVKTETIAAYAIAVGYTQSEIVTSTFTIEPVVATPAFAPAGGTYGSEQHVALTDKTGGATIYFTLDNSTPPTSPTSKKYTAKIAISKTTTINAVAVAPGYISTPVVSSTYTIVGPPSVATNAANQVLDVSATLNATVNDNGGTASAWFIYGASSAALTASTPKATLTAETSAQLFSANLTRLASDMTYYFQPVVRTVGGTTKGNVRSFTTHLGGSILTVTKSAPDAGTITSTPAGISCDTSCKTRAAWFPSGSSVSLTASPNAGMSSLFLGWKGGGCSGKSSCSITLSSNESVTADFAAFSQNTLGWYVVSIGGAGSSFLGWDGGGDPITVNSTDYVYSMILPAADQWIVKDKWASESYAESTVAAFEQDDQVFQVVMYSSDCWFLNMFNPRKASLTQFDLDEFEQQEGMSACDLNHVGIVGNSIYWQRPPAWDPFHLDYDYYGDFGVQKGGKYTSLLSRSDPDNQATLDVTDRGTLYAIYHDSKNGILEVWTRNLTTGKLARMVRGYGTTAAEPLYEHWSFAINDSTLYITLTRKSDGAFQVWSTDLTAPFTDEKIPLVVASYPRSIGSFGGWAWGVDNGHLDFVYVPQGSKVASNIADLDTTTGKTKFWSLGSKTHIVSLVPVWIPGSSSESAAEDHFLHGYPVPDIAPTAQP
ncbi:MAG: chitobiase/beta-hexosaminidase C-terminal domain-containing protein [Terracidiphilus sp.]